MDNSEIYKKYKELHPDWSEEQIAMAISISMEADKTVEDNKDVDPNDPELIRGIMEGARRWLQEVLPDVFAKVAAFFDDVIIHLGEWVSKGLSYVFDAIDYLYDKGEKVFKALKE